MNRIALMVLGALACALIACGRVEPGDSCATDGTGVCDSGEVALWCEGGKLRSIPCRGPGGCISDNQRLQCDVQRAVAGDACPKSLDAQAQCSASNPNKGLVCTNGIWQERDCNGCLVQDGAVKCLQ